jgi:hypothetical protein
VDRPSLVVVGTGIRVIGQLTTEAAAWIRVADRVLYLAHDPVAGEVLRGLNPSSESLDGFYAEGKPRRQSYLDMVEHVLTDVRAGRQICLVFYGHPGVYCWPGHEAVRRARLEGYSARMLPAISAEDCLFADLGIDPGNHGCLSYEATDFLTNDRHADPACLLLLWQVGTVGNPVFKAVGTDRPALPFLVERLCRIYGADHEAILYAAPMRWGEEPAVERVSLGKLGQARLSASSTLCIPPAEPAPKGIQTVSPRRARSKRTPSGVPSPVQPHQARRAR